MALLFIDSFDHYAIGDMTEKWTDEVSGFIVSGGGRCGTNAYGNNSIGAGPTIGLNPATPKSGVVGLAWKPQSFFNQSLLEISDPNGHISIILVTNTAGGLELWSGFSDTPIGGINVKHAASVNGLLFANVWHYLELKWTIDNSAGAIAVRLDGLLVASAAGVDTFPNSTGAYTPDGTWANVQVNATTGVIDDLYILDFDGAVNNDWLGDSHVEALLPELDSVAGGGFHADWTPSAGLDHGALVDETPPDNDATYLHTATPGARETFTYPNLTLVSGTVHGAQALANMRKENTPLGPRTAAVLLRSGGTTFPGTTTGLSVSYRYYREIYDVDPATGIKFTVSGANAVEAGSELIA